MNNDNFLFWKMAFDMRAIDITLLRQAVTTKTNPFGELTEEEFKEISGEDFLKKEDSNSEVIPKEPTPGATEIVTKPEETTTQA